MTFLNGGSLSARGFRVDVAGPDVGEEEVARLFIASLSLLMVATVRVSRLRLIVEPHKGTRGGPSDVGHRGSGGAGTTTSDCRSTG